MKPYTILFCMMSADGSFISDRFDTDLYYETGYALGADAVMTGADSMLTGLESFAGRSPDESCPHEKAGDASLPWLVVSDSKGRLFGHLGHYRHMEFIRDVIVLVSQATPASYVRYLEDNSYGYIRAGFDRCDLVEAVAKLGNDFGIKILRVDSAGALAGTFLDEGLADRLVLITSPFIARTPSRRPFGALVKDVALDLVECKAQRGGHVMATYIVNQ
ncbi:MAG TPA: dihydrofolate reductase family protein [Bacillota bacterium]|nr:dihydrofolate reductase family protein [Bacillota bacterium]HOA14801.1 dihydrofolate reductase family protein [Bacillota bacterium]HOG52996.1 dihydrofolate reductase family protein [Bacillota bacterium]